MKKIKEKNICPILKSKCDTECTWYSQTYEQCAILLQAESTTEIVIANENDGFKVVQENED